VIAVRYRSLELEPGTYMKWISRLLVLCFSLTSVLSCIKIQASPFDTSNGGYLGALATYLATLSQRGIAFSDSAMGMESRGDGSWTAFSFTGPAKIVRVAAVGTTLLGLDGSTAGVLWKSTNYGRSWTAQGGLGAVAFQQIAVCGAGVLLVQTPGGSLGAYYSSDSGVTFSPVTVNATSALTVLDATCINNVFYVSHSGPPTNVSRSTNGSTWVLGSPAPSSAVAVLSGTGSNLFGQGSGSPLVFSKSTDGGLSYSAGDSVANFSAMSAATMSGTTAVSVVKDVSLNTCNFRRSTFGVSGSNSNGLTCPSCTNSTNVKRMILLNGMLIAVGTMGACSGNPPFVMRSTDAGMTVSSDTIPSSIPSNGILNDIIAVY